MPNFEGTGKQRQYWGTENIRKQIFDFGRTGEQINLLKAKKGTGMPTRRASFYHLIFVVHSMEAVKAAKSSKRVIGGQGKAFYFEGIRKAQTEIG